MNLNNQGIPPPLGLLGKFSYLNLNNQGIPPPSLLLLGHVLFKMRHFLKFVEIVHSTRCWLACN